MAQTQIFLGKTQIFVVEELAQDTFEVPAAGDAVLASDVTLTFDSSNYVPAYARPDFLSGDEVAGAQSFTMSFTLDIMGSGAAGTAPHFGEVLKACGMEETTVGSTSVTYSPLSVFDGTGGNPGPSYSFGALIDGKIRYAGYGGFGKPKITGDASTIGQIEVEMMGAYQPVTSTSVALLAPSNYDTTKPPAFRGASAAVNFGTDYTLKGFRSFELDYGNVMSMGVDANEADGFYGARITARKSTGSISCDMAPVAGGVGLFHDWFGIQRASTVGTFTTGVIGGTAGNRYQINANRITLGALSVEDVDSKQGIQVPFGVSSLNTHVEGTSLDLELIFT